MVSKTDSADLGRMRNKVMIVAVILVLLLIQFIPRQHAGQEVNKAEEFNPERSVGEMALLRSACYDCHSYETEYPWYSQIQPVALWIDDHVKEAREELNFSVWHTYSNKKQLKKMDEAIEMIESKEMPLWSFTISHPEARLGDDERMQLVEWLKSIRAQL
jgi:hypothetical protein